jgi:hypothetical protein
VRTRPLTSDQAEAVRFRRARYSLAGRMRQQRRRLLIHALRPNGSFDRQLMIQICKAYFVLPEELGLRLEPVE